MKLLFLAPYAPNPVRVRPYQFIRTLVRRGHELTLASVWTSDQEYADLEVIRSWGVRILAFPMPTWRSLVNSLTAVPSSAPLQTVYSWQPDLFKAVVNELEHNAYDAVHVEHLRGSRYAVALQKQLRRSGRHGPPIVWDSVDCISLLFDLASRNSRSLKGRLMTRLELDRTRRQEADLVRRFPRTLVTSSIDKAALVRLAAGADDDPAASATFDRLVEVIPNGVDLDAFAYSNGADRSPARIVFSGKMSYHANETAALFLVNEVMPKVWERRPDAEVFLVGKDPSPALRSLAVDDASALADSGRRARVVVTGAVPDMGAQLRAATVAAAPLLYGAGIQNKVLEAMACGAPVVATPQACAALDAAAGRELLVAPDAAVFADAIVTLLDSPLRRAELSAAGRTFVEKHHSWGSAAERLEHVYRAADMRVTVL